MKTILAILSFTAVFFNVGCKKDGSGPDPIPPAIIKPDTLSAGWKKIVLDTAVIYADIFFINSTVGFLAGDKAYKTIDGGLTWAPISSKGGFGNIAATGNGNAFFSRPVDDSVYKYVNGGTAVSPKGILGAISGMDVFFTDNNNGFFLTTNGLFATTDGGTNWSKINTAAGIGFTIGYASAYFLNNNTGWIVNPYGIFKTNGTVSSWSQATFTGTQPTGEFNVVYTTPNNTVYATTFTGELYRSVDGGVSFSQIKIFPSVIHEHCDIHFIDNNTGYICAGKRIYKTTDAGANWTVVVALGEANLIELHFTDATHGWACGTKGVVLILN
jgi:photosystem II stability/assembly factor-like uncharacterized protein